MYFMIINILNCILLYLWTLNIILNFKGKSSDFPLAGYDCYSPERYCCCLIISVDSIFINQCFIYWRKSQVKIVITSFLADWRISHFLPGYRVSSGVSGPQQVSEGWMNKLRSLCWSVYPCQFCWLDRQSQYHPLICMMWFCDCNTDYIISI